MTGLKADEGTVGSLVAEFFFNDSYLDRRYFQLVELYAQIYIVYVDEWWEIYTTRDDWFEKIQREWKAETIDSSKWY